MAKETTLSKNIRLKFIEYQDKHATARGRYKSALSMISFHKKSIELLQKDFPKLDKQVKDKIKHYKQEIKKWDIDRKKWEKEVKKYKPLKKKYADKLSKNNIKS